MHRTCQGLVVGAALVAAAVVSGPSPAMASTSTDLAIAATAIVGALLLDANNRPYYVADDRRYYVSQDEANYYRAHHHVVRRQAWVREDEYPVQRNAGYPVAQRQPQHEAPNSQVHFGQGNGNPSHGGRGR